MGHVSVGAIRAVAFTAAVTAISVACLSGCATTPDSAHSRTKFYKFLDSTQVLVGGDWDVRDDPTPRSCDLSIGGAGRTYPGLRIGSRPDSDSVALDAVREAWEDDGFAVEASEIGQSTELKGVGNRGELVMFRIGVGGMTLSGMSACVSAES